MNKQHIIGIIVFSFIVGTFAIFSSIFVEIPRIDSVPVYEFNAKTYKKKRKCKRRKPKSERAFSPVEVKIPQAVFDERTKNLTLDIFLKRQYAEFQDVYVALHYFVNDRNGTRHLATEMVSYSNLLSSDRDFSNTKMVSYTWLRNLQSHENLYVIPEVSTEDYKYENYPPIFNEYKATAILVR